MRRRKQRDLGVSNPFATPIRIRFVGYSLPSAVVANALIATEAAAEQVEREELDIIAEEIPGLPSVALDAARHRFEKYTGSSVALRSTSNGSIVIFGAIVGLAYWLLDKTLGETVTEAWRKSPGHERLVRFFAKRRASRAEKVRSGLRTALAGDGQWPSAVTVQVTGSAIEVEVRLLRVGAP